LRKYELNKRRRREEERLRKEREAANLREARLRAETAESQTKVLQAEREVEKHDMRMRIAADLHDEIGSNLSSITLLSHLMQNRPELTAEIKDTFQDVNKAAKNSTDAIRDIVWLINPESDNLGDLITRLNETANAILHKIELNFKYSKVEATQKLHPEVKRNIYLIYKEILTNIIKHSHATFVEVSIEGENHFFKLNIEDNGVGFNKTKTKQGNGLQNMHYRASQIGGDLRLHSTPGKGTKIQLTLTIT
jgi:signal transduction histidine kinase